MYNKINRRIAELEEETVEQESRRKHSMQEWELCSRKEHLIRQ